MGYLYYKTMKIYSIYSCYSVSTILSSPSARKLSCLMMNLSLLAYLSFGLVCVKTFFCDLSVLYVHLGSVFRNRHYLVLQLADEKFRSRVR